MIENRSIVEKHCTIKEALSLMRKYRRGRSFCISADIFLLTEENRGFPGHTTIRVTYREAQRVVKDVLKNFEARGGKIKVAVWEHIVFIG